MDIFCLDGTNRIIYKINLRLQNNAINTTRVKSKVLEERLAGGISLVSGLLAWTWKPYNITLYNRRKTCIRTHRAISYFTFVFSKDIASYLLPPLAALLLHPQPTWMGQHFKHECSYDGALNPPSPHPGSGFFNDFLYEIHWYHLPSWSGSWHTFFKYKLKNSIYSQSNHDGRSDWNFSPETTFPNMAQEPLIFPGQHVTRLTKINLPCYQTDASSTLYLCESLGELLTKSNNTEVCPVIISNKLLGNVLSYQSTNHTFISQEVSHLSLRAATWTSVA